MTQVLATAPFLAFFDSNGDPLAGGLVYTYSAGTSTPKATYTDSSGVTPMSNPIVLDSAGRSTWWITGTYKYVVKDSLGNTIATTDNVSATITADATQTLTNKTITGLDSASTFNVGAGSGTFKSAGLVNVTNFASVANSGTGETDLLSYVLPANSLSVNKLVSVRFGGTTTNNGNAKTIKVYVNAVLVQTISLTTSSAAKYKGGFDLISAGGNVNNAEVEAAIHGTAIVAGPDRISVNATESSAITIKFTGTGGASNDVSGQLLKVEFDN